MVWGLESPVAHCRQWSRGCAEAGHQSLGLVKATLRGHEGEHLKFPGPGYLASSCGASGSECYVQDAFEKNIARTQPSVICALGNSHLVVMAPYLRSLIVVPTPVEHVASIDSLPWLLQSAYAGTTLHHAQSTVLHDAVHWL